MLAMISVVAIYHHIKLLQYYDYIPYAVLLTAVPNSFYNGKFVPFNPFYISTILIFLIC